MFLNKPEAKGPVLRTLRHAVDCVHTGLVVIELLLLDKFRVLKRLIILLACMLPPSGTKISVKQGNAGYTFCITLSVYIGVVAWNNSKTNN